MATYDKYAGEYLVNGFVREVELYEGAWTAQSVTTNNGDIENTTTNPVGYYAAPCTKNCCIIRYATRDDSWQVAAASSNGNLLRGILIDAPHADSGGVGTSKYRRGKVYFLGVNDIIAFDCDATHAAITADLKVSFDAVLATAKHGITVLGDNTNGIGQALDALAVDTAGTVRVRIVAL